MENEKELADLEGKLKKADKALDSIYKIGDKASNQKTPVLFTGALMTFSELIFSSLLFWLLQVKGIALATVGITLLGSINIMLLVFVVLLAPLIYRGRAYWKAEKRIGQAKIGKELLLEQSA